MTLILIHLHDLFKFGKFEPSILSINIFPLLAQASAAFNWGVARFTFTTTRPRMLPAKICEAAWCKSIKATLANIQKKKHLHTYSARIDNSIQLLSNSYTTWVERLRIKKWKIATPQLCHIGFFNSTRFFCGTSSFDELKLSKNPEFESPSALMSARSFAILSHSNFQKRMF